MTVQSICLDCSEVFPKNRMVRGRCESCEALREAYRGTPKARGYDAEYQRNRARLFREDEHICVICGATENLTADHIVPLAKGGSNGLENLQIACLPCNSRKRDRVPHLPWVGRA